MFIWLFIWHNWQAFQMNCLKSHPNDKDVDTPLLSHCLIAQFINHIDLRIIVALVVRYNACHFGTRPNAKMVA